MAALQLKSLSRPEFTALDRRARNGDQEALDWFAHIWDDANPPECFLRDVEISGDRSINGKPFVMVFAGDAGRYADDPGAVVHSMPRPGQKGADQPLFENAAGDAPGQDRAQCRVHVQCAAVNSFCQRKIEMSPGVQSRDDTPSGKRDQRDHAPQPKRGEPTTARRAGLQGLGWILCVEFAQRI
jgi:hypothetical protein